MYIYTHTLHVYTVLCARVHSSGAAAARLCRLRHGGRSAIITINIIAIITIDRIAIITISRIALITINIIAIIRVA